MKHHAARGVDECKKRHRFFKNENLDEDFVLDEENPIILYFRFGFFFIYISHSRIPLKKNTRTYLTSIYALGRSLCRFSAVTMQDEICAQWNAYEDGESFFPPTLAAIGENVDWSRKWHI